MVIGRSLSQSGDVVSWDLGSLKDPPTGWLASSEARAASSELQKLLEKASSLTLTEDETATLASRLAALALGAAVRILQLVDARAGGERPMSDVLDEAGLPWVAALGRA